MSHETNRLDTLDPENKDVEAFREAGRRLRDASHAHSYHRTLKKANEPREQRRAKVLDLYFGHPPVPHARLKRSGELWRANFSLRDHPSKIGEITSIYYDLIDRVPYMAAIRNSYAEDIAANERYGLRISECFHEFLTTHWTGFVDELEGMIEELVLFDVGPMFFPDPNSFKCRHIKANSMLVPNGSHSNPETWQACEVRYAYPVHTLWNIISSADKRERAKEMGWNPDGILKAIHQSVKQRGDRKDRFQTGDFSSMEQMMQNNDLFVSEAEAEEVQCVIQYVREMDGSIRQSVIYDKVDLHEYLFDKVVSGYSEFRDVLEPYYFGVKTQFHGRRGPGENMYNMAKYLDILGMDLIDTARLDGMFWFKGGRSGKRPNTWQKFAFVDDDLELIANRGDAQMNGTVAASRLVGNKLSNTSNTVDETGGAHSVQPQSAAEIASRRLVRAGIGRAHINRFYRSHDRVLTQIYHRLTARQMSPGEEGYSEQKAFFDDCEDRGIPREALASEFNRVKAYRSVGFGSVEAMDSLSNLLVGLAPSMEDQTKRKRALHTKVATASDYQTAEEYFPLKETDITETAENTLIALEVSHLRGGEAIPVEERQHHTKHIIAIFKMLQEVLQTSAEDPVKAFRVFSVSLANVARRMDFMSKNPLYEQDLKVIKPQFGDFFREMQSLSSQANAVQQQQQARVEELRERIIEAEANKVDPDVLKVMKDHETDMLDTQLQHTARMTKVANEHKEEMFALGIQAQGEPTDADAGIQ